MAHRTIKLAKEMGVKYLWLERYSKNIIDFLNEKNKPTWTIANIIEECIQHLKSFEKTYVVHEYQEANQVADRLANWVVKYNEVAKWIDGYNIPSNINELIEKERIPVDWVSLKGHYDC